MRRREVRVRFAVAGVLFGLAASPHASAFCRTSACELGNSGALCSPAHESDCGVPLHWTEPCVGFSVQRDGSQHFSAEALAELLRQAFATWNDVDCGGARPRFVVERQPDAACAAPEYNVDINVDRGNANVVMFRDHDWPHPEHVDVLALTTVTFDTDTGEIHDADIEINTRDFSFTTSDSDVTYDLLSTLLHETGHFLGIAHSEEKSSVMYAHPTLGSIEHRQLAADDVAAICAVYPPSATSIPATCSPVPRDFAPECGQELMAAPELEPNGGCSVSPAGGFRGAPAFAFALSVFSLARRRRRAQRA